MSQSSEQGVLIGHPFTRETIEQSIPARFEQVAASFADRIALTGNGQSWTYRSLNRRSNQIAAAIRSHTKPGLGCVAFLADQSPEMVIATFGVLKAAKIYLAIHPAMPEAAQTAIMHDAIPDLLLATARWADRASIIAQGICDVVILDQIDGRYSDQNLALPIPPTGISTIFYTSGTTGRPKGVAKRHSAVMHRVWLSTIYDRIVPEDRQSLLTHCAFSASEADIFGVLLQGGRLCVFDPAAEGMPAFREWIDREAITLLHPPVLLFRSLLDSLEGPGWFPSVRLVALAGDVVLPADLRKWRAHFGVSCELLHRFSTAETALLTVGRFDRNSPLEADFVAAGRPVEDKELTLLDEHGQPAATGELMVRSRYIAAGYWRHPEETAAAFLAEDGAPGDGARSYRTGDLARFLDDGSLVFLGRRQHMAKIRGFRVDTREVEHALLALEEITAVAVIVDRSADQDRLWAFVVPRDGAPFDLPSVRRRLRAVLPDWKLPWRMEPLPSLPTTLSGKADRQFLAQLAAGGGTSRVEAPSKTPPRPGQLETELAEIWKGTLSLTTLSLDDHLLDLGGDSISAMRILAEVERRYQVRLALSTLFEHATLRQFAAHLQSQLAGNAAQVKQAPESIPVGGTVADGFLRLLAGHGVDYIFTNPGSDTAPILEAIAKAKALGIPAPELVLCLHESVALAAAHGYFMVTGKPQVVMVHVDVGTLNLGANLHNALRDRAGVVIVAGRSPYTDGSVPGSRNRASQWFQEQHRQAASVEGYVKWSYELTHAANLAPAVERAFRFATATPSGAVYLILPREVLLQDLDPAAVADPAPAMLSRSSADPESLHKAASWLTQAENPLILTGYSGRNPAAVAALVRLAETIAAPVVESRYRVNFPSAHPLHLGFVPLRYLAEADCVLVIDHDVPWVPSQTRPRAGCRIVHLDLDPLKDGMPLWGFPADLAIRADAELACTVLADECRRLIGPAERDRLTERLQRCTRQHDDMAERGQRRAQDLATQRPIAVEWAARCLNRILDDDTVAIGEAGTSGPALWRYLEIDRPGGYYQSLGSGLGWGLGAALGAKLAAPAKTIVLATGDGAWQFGSPMAVYWAAEQRRCPFLTVVFNNQEYRATKESIQGVAPEGFAERSGQFPACDLPPAALISNVAAALNVWTRIVEDPAALEAALGEALAEVRAGRCALVNVCIASSTTRDGTAED